MNPLRLLHHLTLSTAIAAATVSLTPPASAADHRDGPSNAFDAATDIADVYFFRDPVVTDNVVLIATTHGFIVPGEAANEALFDPVVRYRFEIYNKHVNAPGGRPPNPDPMVDTPAMQRTKNAAITKYVNSIKPDKFIDVTFTPRTANGGPMNKEALQIPQPQMAKIQFTGFENINPRSVFSAPVLNPNVTQKAMNDDTAQIAAVTTLDGTTGVPAIPASPGATGMKVFFGETDDPFFFDIPAFSELVRRVREGVANPAGALTRGRDTFAGYNVMTIAISMPITAITKVKVGATFTSPGSIVGVDFLAQRKATQLVAPLGDVRGVGAFKSLDRMGNPAVNVVLIPFNRKNAYNLATPKDDASLKFAIPTVGTTKIPSQPGILKTLEGLGTPGTPFDAASSVGTLASIAVLQGDLLKLDTSAAVGASFPNGRKPSDDVVDTLINVVTGGLVTTGDNVNTNDVPFSTSFPYLAPTQQPLPNTADVDGTKN